MPPKKDDKKKKGGKAPAKVIDPKDYTRIVSVNQYLFILANS